MIELHGISGLETRRVSTSTEASGFELEENQVIFK